MDDKLRNRVLKRLEVVESLPTLPVVFAKIARAIDDPNSTAQDIAKLMEDDPAMVTRILRLVNSSIYSYSGSAKILTVQQAIVRLGFRAVKNVALTTTIFNVFKESQKPALERHQFWRHCIYCGIVANAINTQYGHQYNIAREDLTVVSLLHDIGKIIFEQFFTDIFRKIISFAAAKKTLTRDAEERIFHIDHAEVGAWLAKKWGLPLSIVHSVYFHHYPHKTPEENRPLVSLVNIADYICHLDKLGDSGNGRIPPYYREVWENFGISEDKLPAIRELVKAEAEKSQILLTLY